MDTTSLKATPVDFTGGYDDFYYTNRHGLRLYARDYRPSKPSNLPPLVCLAGLSRNSADFHNLALKLSKGNNARRVIAFDYRGRGLSQYDEDWTRYDVRVEAADISEGLTALNIEKADFLGTSRGGIIIMVLAAIRPSCLGHLILNDIGPKIEQLGLLRIKTYLDSMGALKSWADIHQAFRGPMKEGFPAASERDYAEFVHGIFADKDGKPLQLFDNALLTPLKEMDFTVNLPELWPQFKGLENNTVDILRGENSDLLSEDTLYQMVDMHPKAKAHIISGQAHAPLTNSPNVIRIIEAILASS